MTRALGIRPRWAALAILAVATQLGASAQAARTTFVYLDDRRMPALEGRAISEASAASAAADLPRGGDLYVIQDGGDGVRRVVETLGASLRPTLFCEVEVRYAPGAARAPATSAQEIRLAAWRGEVTLRPTGTLVELTIGVGGPAARSTPASAVATRDGVTAREAGAARVRQIGGALQYRSPGTGTVSLRLYDVRGRLVYRARATAGAAGSWVTLPVATAESRGGRLAGGIYFYRIDARGSEPATGRYVLIR